MGTKKYLGSWRAVFRWAKCVVDYFTPIYSYAHARDRAIPTAPRRSLLLPPWMKVLTRKHWSWWYSPSHRYYCSLLLNIGPTVNGVMVPYVIRKFRDRHSTYVCTSRQEQSETLRIVERSFWHYYQSLLLQFFQNVFREGRGDPRLAWTTDRKRSLFPGR
jgi:hypothetical protein